MLISPIQRRWDSLSFGTRWTERAFQSKALKAVEEVQRIARAAGVAIEAGPRQVSRQGHRFQGPFVFAFDLIERPLPTG